MAQDVNIVVIKGDRVFTISEGRKLARNIDQKAIEDITTGADVLKLKKQYPHANIREYSDTRLSNYYRGLVDKSAM